MSKEYPTMQERATEKIIDSCDASLCEIPLTSDRWYQVLHSLKTLDAVLYSSYEKTLTLEELMPIVSEAIIRIMEKDVGELKDDDNEIIENDDDEIIEDIE
jgi:hypothetical protein